MVQIGVPSPKVVITTPSFSMELDASVSESHSRSTEITQFPVENNSVLTDHIVYQPVEVDIQGIISNTQLIFFTSVPKPSVPGTDPEARAEEAFAALEQLMKEGTRCTIKTTLSEYTNMALASLNTPRDAQRGNMVELNMTWREIRFAETQSIATPEPVALQKKKKATLGEKQATPIDPQTAAKQNAKSFIAKVGEFVGIGG